LLKATVPGDSDSLKSENFKFKLVKGEYSMGETTPKRKKEKR
jgi:hypothetical protein